MSRLREPAALILCLAACAAPPPRATSGDHDAHVAHASTPSSASGGSAWGLDLGASWHGPSTEGASVHLSDAAGASVHSSDAAGASVHSSDAEGASAHSTDAESASASSTVSDASSARANDERDATHATSSAPIDAGPHDSSTNAADVAPSADQAPQKEAEKPAASSAPAQGTPPVANPAAAPPAEAAPQASQVNSTTDTHALDSEGLAIHGSLSSQYRGRFADGQHDNDLYEFLALDVGDPTKDKWTAHLSMRMAADLDGRPPTQPPPLFFSLADTYDSRINTRLYEAHVDGTDVGPLAVVKLGRVIDYETPVFAWFDGAYAQTKPIGEQKLSFGGYAGVPVYLYEDSRSGDVQGGMFAESKLWSQARARLDWMHLEDTSTTGYHSNNLYRLGVWQELGANVRLEGNYSRLDDHNRDWSLRANWYDADDDLSMQAGFYRLLEGQVALSLPIDPFFSQLFELFPYYDARFLVSKGFGSKVNVQAGFDIRRVTHDQDVGEFNRDFERYFLTGTLTDVLPAELVLSVTGEFWDSDSTGIASAGADLSRKFSGKLDTSVGTYYSLYKSDLFNDQERDNVRTYYLRLRYRQGPSLTWDLRYELESVDPGPFNTLILGLVWHF